MTSVLYEIAVRGKERDICDIIFLQGNKQAIKRKNEDICNVSFFNQNMINNPSYLSFLLIFELIYILIV